MFQQWDYYYNRFKKQNPPPFTRNPSNFVKEQIYACFFNDHVCGENLKYWGEDNIMWSNDFPHPNCIDAKYRKRGATAYGRYMLHRAPHFNISSVVWGPGDNAKAHNHDTWGMVGVVENEIQETRFRRKDNGSNSEYADLEVSAVLKNQAGMVSCLIAPDDDIHEMNNVTARDTVEIHVYGKDLTDMPRLRFDMATKI